MADDSEAVAVIARLNANPNLTVFDEVVPDPAPSAYVKVYISHDPIDGDDLTMGSTESVTRVYTHSVAKTAAGVRIVAGQVRASLLDAKLTVTGRLCWPVRHEVSIPPDRNESLGYTVQSQTDTWVLRTKAA